MELTMFHNSFLFRTLYSWFGCWRFPSAVRSYHTADEGVQDVLNARVVGLHRCFDGLRLFAKSGLSEGPLSRTFSTLRPCTRFL